MCVQSFFFFFFKGWRYDGAISQYKTRSPRTIPDEMQCRNIFPKDFTQHSQPIRHFLSNIYYEGFIWHAAPAVLHLENRKSHTHIQNWIHGYPLIYVKNGLILSFCSSLVWWGLYVRVYYSLIIMVCLRCHALFSSCKINAMLHDHRVIRNYKVQHLPKEISCLDFYFMAKKKKMHSLMSRIPWDFCTSSAAPTK